jgi:hypothetical protein
MTVFKLVLLTCSALLSLLVASIAGGLLDYSLVETYIYSVTHFDVSYPFSYILMIILYLPLMMGIAFSVPWIAARLRRSQ